MRGRPAAPGAGHRRGGTRTRGQGPPRPRVPRGAGARVGEGAAPHLDDLLLLLLLRLLAAPGLSLFLGGHGGGGREHRPGWDAAGDRRGIAPRGGSRRESRPPPPPDHTESASLIRRPQRGLCDRSAARSLVGSEARRPEAELRMRCCRRGGWEESGTGRGKMERRCGPAGSLLGCRQAGEEAGLQGCSPAWVSPVGDEWSLVASQLCPSRDSTELPASAACCRFPAKRCEEVKEAAFKAREGRRRALDRP